MLKHHHTSAINQLRKDNLLRAAADAVHPSHPFHLILGLQPLSDTFGFLHLFDQLIKHFLCSVADFLEMLVQFAGQQHPRVDAVSVLAQIPPALFCESVVHILPPFAPAVRVSTVTYADWNSIKDTLDYDFATEKQFSYEGLSVDAAVKHLAKFASDIWQIHPFGEGNTRATAVFMIKYMKTFGFRVNNDAFEKNSWYFRNALVRANYNDLQKGIHSTTKFLELFFSNLLLGTNHDLKNRYMHVDFVDENISQSAKSETPKCQIDTLKCTLEELAVLDLIKKNPSVKQTELAEQTGKSVRSIKRITDSLKEKQYLRRVDGKRYGKWEVLA